MNPVKYYLFLFVVLALGIIVNNYAVSKAKPQPKAKRKPILLIDMDGVIADYYAHFVKVWKKRYPDRVVFEAHELNGMYLEDTYPANYAKDIRKINCGVGFFEWMSPIEGAVDSLNRILDEDEYEVFLCSTPDTDSVNHSCSSEKTRWVEQVLGKRWLKKIILTHDKTLVFGDYLIDDKPSIKGAIKPKWKHIVFTHSYNKHLTDNLRLNKWSEWDSLSNNLLAEFNQTN